MGLFGKKLKDWAEENSLQYEKKVKLGFIRSENVDLEDIIYGTYNGKKVFIFKVIDNSGNISSKHYYCNRKFYKKLKYDEISQIINGELETEMMYKVFGGETKVELIQIIAAELYLNTGEKAEYNDVKNIFENLSKYYKSKVGLSGGVMFDLLRGDVDFDDIEAIDFVVDKINLDRILVENVSKTCKNLTDRYNEAEDAFQEAYEKGEL